MEKIKVNMSPNPLDVQTIHASQNDGEARQWEFELHNNGDAIDSSSIIDQLVFKAYKGGTEEILPTNGSTPTTSPFNGDIKYPQGLLTDQEFLYRESPTEEDGLAKITDIKGNTLVWNQLVQNGNFADTSLWRTYSSTGFSVSNNVGSFTVTGPTGAIYQTNTPTYVSGHKYLVIADFYVSQQSNISVEVSGTRGRAVSVNANTWYRYSDIVAPTAQGNFSLTCGQASVQVKNVMCFDLTQMGLDISNPSDFTSLFPLSYYSYNQGTLLSFMGNGIKTVGFNQWDEEWEMGAYNSADGSKADNVRDRIRNKNPICIFPSVNYYKNKGLQVYYYDANMNYIGWNNLANQGIFTPPSNACYMNFNGSANSGTTYNNDICINISDPSKNGIYEPYVESTLSLPISTYFPTGMKSAGSAYDELTESKAITRIGSVDLGSLTWTRTMQGGYGRFNAFIESGYSSKPLGAFTNVKCVLYTVETSLGPVGNNSTNMAMCGFVASNGGLSLYIRNDSYTDATSFTSAMNGVYLYYELVSSTETSFTTASLVTENAEIPLSNNDGTLIGKCTEQLSENPGFIDAKIKLSDADGECYSNKIQLHVERSPQ